MFLYSLFALAGYFGNWASYAHGSTLTSSLFRDSDAYYCMPSPAPLFSSPGDEPVQLTIKANFDKVFDRSLSPSDSLKTQVNAQITVTMPGQRSYDAKVKLQARGGSRFEDCTFRPLKLKISPEEQKRIADFFPQHLFANLTSEIKLTPLCHKTDKSRRALLKEQLVYRIFGLSNSTTFSTALAQITLDNETNPQNLEGSNASPNYPLAENEWGFFIEPHGSLANRCQLKQESKHIRQRYDNESKSFKWYIVRDPKKLPTDPVARKSYLRNPINWSPYEQFPDRLNLFQFHFFNRLIGNLDYHIDHRHNIKILIQSLTTNFTENSHAKVRTYLVPYDFDISGAVDGGILTFSKSPREAARDFMLWMDAYDLNEAMPRTWLEAFVNQETAIMELIANSYLDAKGKEDLYSWFGEHFTAIKTFLAIP